MRIRNILIGASLAATALCGCEQVIEFRESETPAEGVTINAVISPDTVLTATVTKAFLYNEIPQLSQELMDDTWLYEGLSNEDILQEMAMVDNATVTATVNGATVCDLRYDSGSRRYLGDYRPRAGDHIVLQAVVEGFPVATAEAVVPAAQQMELVAVEKVYSSRWDDVTYEDGRTLLDFYGQDTVARITLRIVDPPGANYYRLKVRSIGDDSSGSGLPIVRVSDIYQSDDDIFKDSRLHKGYGGWAAGFSSVFDDRLCEASAYTLTLESRLRKRENRYLQIELQSLTRDFYFYVKSCELYRITKQDDYTEALQIYSNVRDGWGIVGGVCSEKHIVRF